jgi:hypothetical protein
MFGIMEERNGGIMGLFHIIAVRWLQGEGIGAG